jgi:predicted negative regulator of RcsB-dependent stress response
MSHYEDEAQLEQLRRWWRENWMALAGGLVLGLGGIFGWEAWQKAQTGKAEQASQIYEDLKKAAGAKPEQAADLGKTLMQDYSATPYAAQAALLLAQKSAEAKDWVGAEERLNWVIRNGDTGLQKIARLRLARVLWQQDKPQDALAQLEAKDDDAFASLYQELRGDILLSQNDRAAARQAYEKALALDPAPASREFLQRKLDDLAGAAS